MLQEFPLKLQDEIIRRARARNDAEGDSVLGRIGELVDYASSEAVYHKDSLTNFGVTMGTEEGSGQASGSTSDFKKSIEEVHGPKFTE